mmetsp:Transcript_33355/g.87490  ORF Transcript_33355/g.87490 Transcript_33355/m.87490 type:complete len:371 (-) Transcript_33355:1841-2953(-)
MPIGGVATRSGRGAHDVSAAAAALVDTAASSGVPMNLSVAPVPSAPPMVSMVRDPSSPAAAAAHAAATRYITGIGYQQQPASRSKPHGHPGIVAGYSNPSVGTHEQAQQWMAAQGMAELKDRTASPNARGDSLAHGGGGSMEQIQQIQNGSAIHSSMYTMSASGMPPGPLHGAVQYTFPAPPGPPVGMIPSPGVTTSLSAPGKRIAGTSRAGKSRAGSAASSTRSGTTAAAGGGSGPKSASESRSVSSSPTRGAAKRIPADLAVDIPHSCRGPGELGWHPDLLAMSTIHLNDFVTKNRLDPDHVRALKALRRRIKNRLYTQKARARQRSSGIDVEISPDSPRVLVPVENGMTVGVQCRPVTRDAATQTTK